MTTDPPPAATLVGMPWPRDPSRRPTRADAAAGIALALAGVAWLSAVDAREVGAGRAPDALGYALVVVAALSLVARRGAPIVVFAVSMGATEVASMAGYAVGNIPSIAPLVALGSAAYLTSRRAAIALVAAASALLAARYATAGGDGSVAAGIVPDVLVVWLAALAGDVLREQHAHARTLRQRTEELARLRSAERREAIVGERARIARDMHDIVGHALAAIALQARAGRRRLARGGVDGADDALREIDAVAGQALADTRRAVGLLRSTEHGGPPTRTPVLSDLDELVMALRTADLQIEVERDTSATTLPAAVQAVAYRVVQESLSNVVKHAQPARATVTVRQGDGTLAIDVRDDGAATPRPSRPGHGLQGMRERVEAAGGTLQAGPATGGGWHVHAVLPPTPA